MMNLPAGLEEKVYPLAWLIGNFEGSGKLGGNFGIADQEFESTASWQAKGDKLEYQAEIKANGKPYLTETGIWQVAKQRPENLEDERQFPVEAKITTTLAGDDKSKDNTPSWTTEYLGIIGYGRLELVSDKIDLQAIDQKLGDFTVNDLYRSKRMYGWVNNRILWAWDIALIGADQMKSIAAGGLWAA